jgi:hypothetical protein
VKMMCMRSLLLAVMAVIMLAVQLAQTAAAA